MVMIAGAVSTSVFVSQLSEVFLSHINLQEAAGNSTADPEQALRCTANSLTGFQSSCLLSSGFPTAAPGPCVTGTCCRERQDNPSGLPDERVLAHIGE